MQIHAIQQNAQDTKCPPPTPQPPQPPPPPPPPHPPPAKATAAAAAADRLLPTLPSAETQRQVAEARAALVASMSNLLDTSLQGRAATLHAGATALTRQEREVARAADGLRVESQRLAREADAAAKRLKEIGNVQNWAEVLETGFLVVEETLRMFGMGGGGEWV
ncbi:hypothetical protein L249_2191 [Ophiocordyceps polyrhachis-furcata BCC 54312]|uniref:Biogenesis of lysosome-related organelles complex 1 subunit 1 n=1 Tax=Ophiocordyceps polyrhachis-furcata BCC 54312 TaxID=1330021 RepID=A0A367LP01_9HYPO|nr:hypothetical protein L249_2191 [Ophiocordyceps polyrhachis-furcata BCC 54312]